jgi:myxalamid-type nonribosomal peptide synthetase MxaA
MPVDAVTPMQNGPDREAVREALQAIIAGALGLETADVSPDVPFLEMGASSLALVDAFRAIQERFGVRPSIRKVFEAYDRLERLADYIVELLIQRPAGHEQLAQAHHAALLNRYNGAYTPLGLTAGQRHVWFLAAYSEGAMLAHTHRVAVQLTGALDAAVLQRAFEAAADRHDALRLTFDAGESQQRIASQARVTLEVVDFSAVPGDEQKAAIGGWLRDDSRRPFEPTDALWRAALLRLASDRHLLVISAHALVADDLALHKILSEVAAIYTAGLASDEPNLGEAASFREFVELLAVRANQPEYQNARDFWYGLYADAIPQLDLAWWQRRPPVKSYAGARLVVPLPSELTRALQSWNGANRSSSYATLLAAFQVWLQRISGQEDFVVGIFSRGATLAPRSGALIANSTNPLPLRAKVDPAVPFAAHLGKVQQSLLAAFDHQDYPFSAIIADLQPERDQSRSTIFTVAFDWQPGFERPDFGALDIEQVTAPVNYVPYDLFVTVVERNGRMQLQCDYSTELFDAATMRRWMNSFRALLADCLQGDGRPISRLHLLTPEDRHQLLVEWNDTGRPFAHDTCIHELIEAQADRTPASIALVAGEQQLTYAQLNAAAEQVAARLRQAGIGPGDFVAACLDRNAGMLAGILGILKAGGAFVPLDPSYPVERLAFMLNDSGAASVLTEARLRDRFPEYGGTVIVLDEPGLDPPSGNGAARQPAADDAELGTPNRQNRGASADRTAVMFYTSGSTGWPKGVPITHRSIVNVLQSVAERPGLAGGDRVLAVTTYSFDISETELLLPLMVGATIVLANRDETADGGRLRDYLEQSGITAMQATPATWRMLLAAGWPGDGQLKMLSAGEALTRELADGLLARGGSLWNLYGPTETTTYSTAHQVSSEDSPVPIGRPIANTQVFILDRLLQPVPVGVPGELCIGGAGVSPGYWQRPEVTAEKFVPNPFRSSQAGETHSAMLYRTGDVVRYLPNGTVSYLGRTDFQVKVKGFRIELGEVESTLSCHPTVEHCVVAARDDGQGQKMLAGYFVVRAGEPTPTATGLRAFLAERLPDYMIPAAFVPLTALPLTPNGKVDRNALPAPDAPLRAGLDQPYQRPRNRVEEILCRIWGEVLGLENVGIRDNFFELGGHSLLLTPLVLKLREYFGLRLSMREFFERPTVAELAEMISAARGQAASAGNGHWISPTLRQDGPEAQARFVFLRQEAQLGPSLLPTGRPFDASSGRLRHLLMTGATGFVGACMLRDFMEQSDVHLYCLVRAGTEQAGMERIRKRAMELGQWDESYQDRITVVPGDVSQPRLGIDMPQYQRLAHEVDAILHSAAVVNFIYPYQAMKAANVDGVRHVIEFAFEGQVKPVHYLSTTAIWPMGAHRTFTEEMDLDHDLLLNLAYDETKWVAEKMLREAASRGLPVAVYRPGEVSGDSRTGQSDLSHLASALLKGSIQAGMFPALDSFLDAAPVDYVAEAIVFLMTRRQPLGRVFHLCNPRPMHAHDAYQWLRKRGYVFDVLPFAEWRLRLLTSENFAENALYPFAALLEEFTELSLQLPVWDTTATVKEFEGSSVACPALDERLADVYLRFFIESGYVPAAEAMLNSA